MLGAKAETALREKNAEFAGEMVAFSQQQGYSPRHMAQFFAARLTVPMSYEHANLLAWRRQRTGRDPGDP